MKRPPGQPIPPPQGREPDGKRYEISSSDGLSITIKDPAARDEIDARQSAIVALIENADGDRMDSMGEGFERRHQFYGAVLKAVALHYMLDGPNATTITYEQCLDVIMRECRERPGIGLDDRFEYEEV